ncbi:MAG: phosphotransferase family protein [Hyphomonadaceae bacterium]
MPDLEFAPSSTRLDGLALIGAGRQAETYAWAQDGVVKLFREVSSRASAQQEAAAMYALDATEIPMPRILGTVTIGERPGIVMERLAGSDQLSLLGRQPWSIWTVATNLARLHAHIHALAAPDQLPPLRATVKDEIARSDGVPADCKELAFDALDRLPDGSAICHWDFHPGNVIESPDGLKLIDWASACRGDARADVARTLLILRGGALPPGAPLLTRTLTAFGRSVLAWRYLDEYRRLRPFEDKDLELWDLVSAVSRLSYGVSAEREQSLSRIRGKQSQRT